MLGNKAEKTVLVKIGPYCGSNLIALRQQIYHIFEVFAFLDKGSWMEETERKYRCLSYGIPEYSFIWRGPYSSSGKDTWEPLETTSFLSTYTHTHLVSCRFRESCLQWGRYLSTYILKRSHIKVLHASVTRVYTPLLLRLQFMFPSKQCVYPACGYKA